MAVGLFEAIAPALVFGVGGLLVIRGQLALGTIVAFVALLKRLYGPASQLASTRVELMTSYAYFERVFEVLDRVPSIRSAPDACVPASIAGRLEFKNVSFAYAGDAEALCNVSLTIPAGTTVAFVGPSGAGKSTIASLVMRLYDPTAGGISLDGVDLRRLDLASLRSAVALVTQETFLTHATVLENLRYGRPSASRREVEEAAQRAHVHDVIAALPQGYQTMVGERGYLLSAGERQRLAIARAMLKNPRILILDEATSALDTVSEQRVQQALAPLCAGRTTLIIAHRLHTIRDADLIVVVEHGCVVERGRHKELLARAGLYAWLWQSQLREPRGRPVSQPQRTATAK
jgi:ATP-binding cassette subfamily B protein